MTKIFTIEKFLNEKETELIFEKCKNELKLENGLVYNNNEQIHIEKVRKSNIAFIKDLGFLNNRLIDVLMDKIKINGFELSGLGDFQFTEYQKDDYYNWHTDSTKDVFKERFYSTIIQISDEYEGGELEIIENDSHITLEKGLGNLFLFPSTYLHRIKPITNGVRYSLVNWVSLIPLKNNKKSLI